MTNDQKIETILKKVDETQKLAQETHKALQETQKVVQETQKLAQETHKALQETQKFAEDTRELVKIEHGLNNDRFVQLSTGLHEVRLEVKQTREELNQKVDQAFSTLTEDIQAISGDVEKLKKRMDRVEQKVG